LYVATGIDIVVVSINEQNGVYSAQTIVPYEPNTNELKYIGTNALLGFGMQSTNNNALTNLNQFSVKGIAFSEDVTNKTLINAQTKERFTIKTYVTENASITPPTGQTYVKRYRFSYKPANVEFKETKSYTVVPPPVPPAPSYNPENEIVAANNGALINIVDGSSYEPNTNSIEVYDKNGIALVTGLGYDEFDSTTIILRVPAVAGDRFTIKYIPHYYSKNSKYGTFSQSSLTSNTVTFRPLEVGFYNFKVEVEFSFDLDGVSQTRYISEYVYQGLQVKSFREDGDVLEQIVAGAKKCNKIRLHFDRLMLFGDPDEPTQLYFSDINNPAYFPQVNTFRFDTGKQEAITAVVRLNDFLVVFSKSLIHTLTGRSKEDFLINLINDSVGCVAERSAVLTGNVITFLSEEGIFQLKPSTFRLDQLNVQRVDTKIKSEIKKVSNACALNYDSQYWICYPDDKVIYRYYYEKGVWVKDTSDKLNFVQFLQEGQNIFSLSKDVKLYKNDPNIYTDDGFIYDMIVESKYFDLSKSFNFKKLRKLYVLAKAYNVNVSEYDVYVYADSAIVLEPETGYAYVDENDYVAWKTEKQPNLNFSDSTIFGSWGLGESSFGERFLDVQKARIRGKCRRVKVKFINSQTQECELFGFGLEFKLKKP
jgi:hypothetical protein